ncbi:MAG: ABC transporter permease [Lachnospiraceae bacterium]|nr:ABC transporter permease [Lachnospiraceae bacterium]
MRNIIKADLYRIFRSKGVYIALAVFLLLTVLQVLFGADGLVIGVMVDSDIRYDVVYNADGTVSELIPQEITMNGRDAPFIFADVTDNLIYLILPFIVFIVAVDFQSGAVKNILSSGISRYKYFFAKFSLMALVSASLMAVYLFLPIILGTILYGYGGEINGEYISAIAEIYLPQFYLVFAYVCVGLFVSFAFKSVAALNTIYIMLSLLPTIIIAILIEYNEWYAKLLDYVIVLAIKTFSLAGGSAPPDTPKALMIGGIYMIFSIIGGILLFRKAEIK